MADKLTTILRIAIKYISYCQYLITVYLSLPTNIVIRSRVYVKVARFFIANGKTALNPTLTRRGIVKFSLNKILIFRG